MNLRTKAEASAASAEEKSRKLEAKLSNVSESIECEKIQLQNELVQLKSESKLSVSKISADVSLFFFLGPMFDFCNLEQISGSQIFIFLWHLA